MSHIAKCIEVDEPVASVHEQWSEFEQFPQLAIHQEAEARLSWRAEVLTLEPLGPETTRVTLRIEYDPPGDARAVSRSVEGALERFRDFLSGRGREARAWQHALAQRVPVRS